MLFFYLEPQSPVFVVIYINSTFIRGSLAGFANNSLISASWRRAFVAHWGRTRGGSLVPFLLDGADLRAHARSMCAGNKERIVAKEKGTCDPILFFITPIAKNFKESNREKGEKGATGTNIPRSSSTAAMFFLVLLADS